MARDLTSGPLSTFSAKLDSYRARVDGALFAELQQRTDSLFFDPLVKMLTDGKRLRPILLLLAYESVDGHKDDPLPASVAVELAHVESLIHDDIIDGDVMRRKAASFHASYGHEMGLLSADFTPSLILGITACYADPRIATALATATAQMCEGELEEINEYATDRIMPPDVYLDIVAKKQPRSLKPQQRWALLSAVRPAQTSMHSLPTLVRLVLRIKSTMTLSIGRKADQSPLRSHIHTVPKMNISIRWRHAIYAKLERGCSPSTQAKQNAVSIS